VHLVEGGEGLDFRAQPVTDLLQPIELGRVGEVGEPVVQRGERDPRLGRLPLGPLMPVETQLSARTGPNVGVTPAAVGRRLPPAGPWAKSRKQSPDRPQNLS
jgi:hypothetical protein